MPGLGRGYRCGLRQSPWQGGFTLIELLVVVSIIAVVVALLLPALAGARRSTGAVACKSVLAGLGRATQAYANDYKGSLPTFAYPLDGAGLADPVVLPEWGRGGGGWVVLPINEIAFWAYPLRGMIEDQYQSNVLATVEQMSCPQVFAAWEREFTEDELLRDPMVCPQNSYLKSTALFSRPSAWRDRSDQPDLNAVHAAVRVDQVVHPSAKTLLVEQATVHEPVAIRLEARPPGSFNVLATDGHARGVQLADAEQPHGFTAHGVGTEVPPIDPDRWRDSGIPLVSTHRGAAGQDW